MLEKIDDVDKLVQEHKDCKIAFNDAWELLQEKHGFDKDEAYNLLFPPFPSKRDIQANPPQNLIGLGIKDWLLWVKI